MKLLLKAKRFTSESLIQADINNLPFRKEFADIVVMSEVIEHLVDPYFAIRNVEKILKKGGCLVLTFPNTFAYYPVYPF